MADDKKTYYGWKDIANLEEAVEFYAEKWAFGHTLTEINRMLNEYFPRIDYITCGKIRVKALKKLYVLAKQIEKGNYIAESIMRLRRLMANPHEKTKNILAADSQLTHLLGLANAVESETLEDRAAAIRDFMKKAREATNGSAFAASESESEPENKPENKPETNETNETQENKRESKESKEAQETKETQETQKETKSLEHDLILARAQRLKLDIVEAEEELKRNRQRLDDEEGI